MICEIDLHTHTCRSDGAFLPTELLRLCREQGLKRVAICDHDTAEGLDEAYAAAPEVGISLVPGVELTARFSGEMHILGLGIDWHHPAFTAFTREQREIRTERNRKMLHRLRELGYAVDEADMARLSGGDSYGRSHMARALTEKGYVSNPKEAFTRIIGHGCPGYMTREKPTSKECIRVIRESGGDAVLAHPGLTGVPDRFLEPLVRELTEEGLTGVEAFYPAHNEATTRTLCRIAENMDLYATYGSDYHGPFRAGTELLAGFKNIRLPMKTLIAAERWASVRPSKGNYDG